MILKLSNGDPAEQSKDKKKKVKQDTLSKSGLHPSDNTFNELKMNYLSIWNFYSAPEHVNHHHRPLSDDGNEMVRGSLYWTVGPPHC